MKNVILAAVAFCIPITIVVAMNWENVEPYVTGDPDLAEGRLLYFAASG